jgi:hypothetical protein
MPDRGAALPPPSGVLGGDACWPRRIHGAMAGLQHPQDAGPEIKCLQSNTFVFNSLKSFQGRYCAWSSMKPTALLGTAALAAVGLVITPLSAKAFPTNPGLESFVIDCNCSNQGYSGTVGWHFTVNKPMGIQYLGAYDQGGDGLAVATDVGLWDLATNTQLASATVPAGTAGILKGQFRYTSIDRVVLEPGNTYSIGALYTQPYQADWYQAITKDNIFADWITYGNPAENSGTVLEIPFDVGQSPFGIYGPNLAPAPGPVPLLGAGAAFAWSRRLRRRVASRVAAEV